MILRCPDCRSTYEVAGDRVPEPGQKLRCPRCKAVFPVASAVQADAGATSPGGPVPALPPGPGARSASEPSPDPQPRPEAPAPAPPRPRIVDPALARRMARAMISEMVLNRRSERDEALRREELLLRFGPAIAGAFDVYRGKVSPDLDAGPRLFREAVNEILGEGQPIL